jgi:nucleotide-binding universal stress UspA family protein
MARYRKILVAYDGSASAQNALSLASQLAREDKSWIKVLAVMPSYEGDLELVGISNIREAISGQGQKLLAEAQAIADREDVLILTNLEQGEPYERIIHVAEDENCDLIMLGRRGRNRLERELMGSVTARVIGHTGKDVMVVPEPARLSWNRLLLATDGSFYSEKALKIAVDLAQEKGAQITAASVVFTNDEFSALAPELVKELIATTRVMLEEVRSQGEASGVRIETIVKEGEPHQAITSLAADMAADLIIMGSHGRKGLTRLLMGSVTERVVGFAPCPVLIANARGSS